MWFFSEEERDLQHLCRDFAKKELAPYAEKHDHDESFNMDAFKMLPNTYDVIISGNRFSQFKHGYQNK